MYETNCNNTINIKQVFNNLNIFRGKKYQHIAIAKN